ncbi:serine/threonine-protein kinase [Mycolicibacterium aubagnense]|uniref:non-specific serine/threonine protein kinase n=1 Tax=Mycolicibacterium aubagnense TaxID=319707 RepID=A0ABM7IGM3_9MYCO|nr:serine/threonine-protein kinase [Mycolicibacterium aubagnense]TLH70252.1 serine/threonine protein kinase [Mycolicibacterium aubagnense]WGI32587.1 serine/threonine-protein kinase [Mycolicibacterium aubagnense]BBX85824.1 serine/threonine protein kinase [Mycolicibacterium aubagnense]
MSLPDGSVFAGFTVVRSLGAGGMGEVYLAAHPRLPRTDALKVLPASLSADAEYRRRFEREADAAATLWHPHIVGVHDRGECDGRLWISMDYVEGSDAGNVLRTQCPGGMPRDQVFAIVTAIADALDYAHSRGLLHRDVKPANILLGAQGPGRGRVMLADFGIARRVDDFDGLTSTNMTLGTPGYAAPEQLLGEALDGRADQYALAATAFQLLTGQPPGGDSTPVVLISQRVNGVVPKLAEVRRDLADLDPVMAIAMARRPADRFPSCADFAAALARGAAPTLSPAAAVPGAPTGRPDPPAAPAGLVRQPDPPAAARSGLSPTAWALGGIGALLVLALVFVGLVLMRGRDERSGTTTSAEATTAVGTSDVTVTSAESTAPEPSATLAPTTARMVLPDADSRGFTTYNGAARCAGADEAAMILRTAQSAVVICRSSVGVLYYLGYRLSDGAKIRLGTVHESGDGYIAINDPDSAEYHVSSSGLEIVQNGKVLASEPAVESAR